MSSHLICSPHVTPRALPVGSFSCIHPLFSQTFSPVQQPAMPGDNPFVSNANKFNMGICVTPILFGWNETLKFYEKLGIDNIEKKVRGNGDYCVERLNEIGCKVLTPEDPKKRHGLIVYTTGSYDLDAKSVAFFNQEWTGQKPIKLTHRGIGGILGIRVSNHFFNSKEDIDYLIEAQKKVINSK